jgi:uncharacterized protein YndB with AHSA1/START domain
MTVPKVNPELDLVLERFVDVRADLLWKAWTEPEHLKRWFAPHPTEIVACEVDLTPGGLFSFTMRLPDGTVLPPNVGCYLEIEPARRLVWTDGLAAGWRPKDGGFLTAVIDFEPEGSGTRYTATALHKDPADRQKHEDMGFFDGWSTVLDQLVEYAPTLQLDPNANPGV